MCTVYVLAAKRPSNMQNVSRGCICLDIGVRCLSEIKAADRSDDVTRVQHTDKGPASPNACPITPAAWQGLR